jgi:hypothetical protein
MLRNGGKHYFLFFTLYSVLTFLFYVPAPILAICPHGSELTGRGSDLNEGAPAPYLALPGYVCGFRNKLLIQRILYVEARLHAGCLVFTSARAALSVLSVGDDGCVTL